MLISSGTDHSQWFAQQSPHSEQPDYLQQLMMSPASEPASSPTATTQYLQQQQQQQQLQQHLDLGASHVQSTEGTQPTAAMPYTAAAQYVLEGTAF